ncbi:YiiX/YebB-like N1pC/P60 family cysteine hydrolase [Treponema sp.]|uniref:YiiX/YebB-like N1pC/P60 family cysteine hydrolase n=1 Tax=Treponema sp. TaxID=166 RepID=UPI002579B07F|nr:YiiX/YebB-like N1pC/P60 family cysteine hydrolase [Treponema sp.]MBE6355080.1 UDP-N-acetylmuramoylalanyl-D-glutamate--2,6-diaminopimelate ligase [Treponema sp.]
MNTSNLKNGDLLFMTDDSELSKAIIEATEKYSHVGIYFDGMIYHASRKRGVAKQNLAEYLAEEKRSVFVYRYPEIETDLIRERAEKYIGCEYNHSFYPDNGKFYCSQYVAEILPIFDVIKMKFGDGKKEITDYWKEYYKELNLPVPSGQPGTNPGQLAKSEKLLYIGKLSAD